MSTIPMGDNNNANKSSMPAPECGSPNCTWGCGTPPVPSPTTSASDDGLDRGLEAINKNRGSAGHRQWQYQPTFQGVVPLDDKSVATTAGIAMDNPREDQSVPSPPKSPTSATLDPDIFSGSAFGPFPGLVHNEDGMYGSPRLGSPYTILDPSYSVDPAYDTTNSVTGAFPGIPDPPVVGSENPFYPPATTHTAAPTGFSSLAWIPPRTLTLTPNPYEYEDFPGAGPAVPMLYPPPIQRPDVLPPPPVTMTYEPYNPCMPSSVYAPTTAPIAPATVPRLPAYGPGAPSPYGPIYDSGAGTAPSAPIYYPGASSPYTPVYGPGASAISAYAPAYVPATGAPGYGATYVDDYGCGYGYDRYQYQYESDRGSDYYIEPMDYSNIPPTPTEKEKRNWTMTPLSQPYPYSYVSPYPHKSEWDSEDACKELDSKLNSKRTKLVMETRKRWFNDLFKAVFGYGLISLGIMMFLLGLVYLYDADMQYRNRNLMHDLLVGNETTRGVDMEFGCNSTLYLAATEVDSSQAPLTALCLDALTSPSNYSSDSPDLYIYLTASRPYLALSSILFSYTLIVLTLAVFRTSRKIMRCVNEGNAFVERYLSAKMNRNGPWSSTRYPTTLLGCGCTICSWTSAYQPHYHCRCPPTCIECSQTRVYAQYSAGVHTKTDILVLFETLKPSTPEEWIQKVSWMFFTLHMPMVFFLSVFGPLVLAGPVPGMFLDYSWNVFMVMVCAGCIVRFTRQVLSLEPKPQEKGSTYSLLSSSNGNDAEYIEGEGMTPEETRVSVPWVCAKMWEEMMGEDWEDMVRVWREEKRRGEEEKVVSKYRDELDARNRTQSDENEKMHQWV